MLKKTVANGLLVVLLLSQTALADSTAYHLKRLEIQTRALQAMLEGRNTPLVEEPEDASPSTLASGAAQPLEQRLEEAVKSPTWAEQMVQDDLESLLSTAAELQERLKKPNEDEYLKARVELESLARRLRISTAPLQLDPQQKATLELTILELEESISALGIEREQQIAEREKRRARTRIDVGVGWGGWSPWGYSTWGYPWGHSPYGWNHWYRPYPRYYRPGRR